MNVAELIAILQIKDPQTTVVMRDSCSDLAFVEVRAIDSVTMRAYARKGICFLISVDAELPNDEKTDVFAEVVHGVLLE